jgi:hypothetical protein
MLATRLAMLIAIALMVAGCSHDESLTMPATPPMSAEQKAAAYSAALDARWDDVSSQYPSAVRPSADRVRYVTPGEMPSIMAECISAAGFEATDTTDSDGPSFSASSPDGQEQALAVAWYVCDAQYPVDPEYTQPLSADEIAFMYRYNSSVLLPCLRDLGLEVDDAPSQQSYVETFGTADGWYPYNEVYQLGRDAAAEASKACPQNPPGFRE